MDDYFSKEAERLASIRLLIEGAVTLYENDAQPISRLTMASRELEAYAAFDAIGKALLELRQEIRLMQSEHMQHVASQMNV